MGERTYGSRADAGGRRRTHRSTSRTSTSAGAPARSSATSARTFSTSRVGRTQYKLGHGMLLWDGAAEGGTRGGYWTNARKAFEFAAIGRFKPGNHTVEAFYLDKDELPGVEYRQQALGRELRVRDRRGHDARRDVYEVVRRSDDAPQRDGLDVYNLRAYTAPFSEPEGALFRGGVRAGGQRRCARLRPRGTCSSAYQFETTWKPKISYRYAFFEGDDPGTPKNEAFDGLLTGFYDWGTWWQGEIAGEYFVSNSNLISHQLRVHTKPTEAIATGLIFYDFLLDKPARSAGVTSDKVANELDWYMDWSVNDNFLLSFVAAVADPGEAVEQSSGRTDTFFYGMVFAAYSF